MEPDLDKTENLDAFCLAIVTRPRVSPISECSCVDILDNAEKMETVKNADYRDIEDNMDNVVILHNVDNMYNVKKNNA